MTAEELSNEFDTLLNSGQQLGAEALVFDEYEKSVFLTKAYEEVIKSLYNGSLLGKSFEETEELRKYLSPLVKTSIGVKNLDSTPILASGSMIYDLPEDLWFITHECVISSDPKLNCGGNAVSLEVIPTTQDDLHKTLRNPFKRNNKHRVLRLDTESTKDTYRVELITDYSIDYYRVSYISKLEPIILVTLPDNLSINGYKNKTTEFKLNSALYRIILELAVNTAIKSKARFSAGK